MQSFYGARISGDALADAHYRVVACARCDFIYQDPVLDDAGMQTLYQDWVDQDASLAKKLNAGSKLYRGYAGQMQTLQRLMPRPPQQTRVLDFGMGWGYWCRMAQAHGFDASGFELSARRREHARALGLRVIDKLPPAGEGFDFIYANQVFEHLPEPLASLQELCGCLNSDGILYLRVPDGRGLRRRLQRRGWSPELDAIHPLEHINCFTRSSLIQLAEAAGLQPLQPPLRLHWGSLLAGLRREILDRCCSTHVMFRC
jgi:SAM-dependent methyltransferase